MIGLMNYNLSREDTGKSLLADIQNAYLQQQMGRELTPEQVEMIGRTLVTDPNMLDNPSMYPDLKKVMAKYEMLKNSFSDTKSNQNYTM